MAQAQQPAAAQPKPEPVAGADPTSSPGTCGLVRVKFETSSAEIRDQFKPLLKATADCLKTNQKLTINIEGNTDERGTQEYNKALGERRAQAVSQFLQSEGVSQAQIKLINFGEDNPRCLQSDAACWAKNRRTAIRPTCRM
jgi:peptidoglycan-associated lipoprotein